MGIPEQIGLHIRRIIFEKFNDPDLRFNNDQIFELLQKDGTLDDSVSIDDMEPYFKEICDSGLVRNIAQNFTTIWFKLFDTVEKSHCSKCDQDIYVGRNEDRVCPNPSCKAEL